MPARRAPAAEEPRRLRVLVADDHPLLRAGVRRVLEMDPAIEVVADVSTGRDAIEMARRAQPDVVLMDIEMPDMDGLAATRAIKREMPGASVVVFTGHDDTAYLREALAAGASGFVLKGAEAATLRESLHLLRNGESLIDTRLLGRLVRELERPGPEPAGSQAARLRGPAAELPDLSALERHVLRGLADGLTNGEIAAQLHYSVGTVKNAVQRIIEKLGVSDRTQAAVKAVRSGLVE